MEMIDLLHLQAQLDHLMLLRNEEMAFAVFTNAFKKEETPRATSMSA